MVNERHFSKAEQLGEQQPSSAAESHPKTVLVIGASSGIAQAVTRILLHRPGVEVIACSRMAEQQALQALTTASELPITTAELEGYRHITLQDYDADSIAEALQQVPKASIDMAVCCLGVLHDQGMGLSPEKRIEDLDEQQLLRYFHINTVIPSLWLRALVSYMVKASQSKIILLSARVGSITDNKLGGWYGYRASKSALNMLVKTAQVEFSRRIKKCTLVLYHPGTVDTKLSKPFQGNVPPGKLFTPEFTAMQMLQCVESLQSEQAPHYIDWKGDNIPW